MIREILIYIIISLAGATSLVFVSKYILNFILRRNNDYYEKIELNEERSMLRKAGIKSYKIGEEDVNELK